MILIENIFKCLVWPKMKKKKKKPFISEPTNHHQIDTRKPTHDHLLDQHKKPTNP